MTAFLSALLGRLPIGWLQLTHSPLRLVSALAGVAFANVLVFVQLGIMGALNNTILTTYEFFDADIMISASDANTLTDGGNVARAHMFQALGAQGVASAMPLYVRNVDWTDPAGTSVSLRALGVDPNRSDYLVKGLRRGIRDLSRLDTMIVDRETRNVDATLLSQASQANPLNIEVNGRAVSIIGSIEGGGGFGADGYALVSDQTFLRLVPSASAGAPKHLLLKIEPGAQASRVIADVNDILQDTGLRIRSVDEAAIEDQIYQTTERPTGVIFGFGVVIGILVGIVIVYQVLSTDVADHLKEYATFKAMGYRQRFFLGVVMEEAVILGAIGFVPGIGIAIIAYQMLETMTGLPMVLTTTTAISVFVGTVAACALSGAIATRRLAAADPADLF
ncbi:MAG: FtsX-like permease family protein [Pseudomonadota bacterium]